MDDVTEAADAAPRSGTGDRRGRDGLARYRRWQRASCGTLAVGLLLLLGSAIPLVQHGSAPASTANPPIPSPGMVSSLPDRIGVPAPGAQDISDAPAGPAAVLFGDGTWWDQSKSDLALVGATTDQYRLEDDDQGIGHAGEEDLLSPDGTQLAITGAIVDLSTGARYALPLLAGLPATPAAWAPDGRHLAVVTERLKDHTVSHLINWPTPAQATLYIIDLATQQSTRIADLAAPYVYDGLTVAFAPGGKQLAYQSGKTIRVADLTGAVLDKFTVPATYRLAGKGAWTPDGHGLTLLYQRHCCVGDAYAGRWQLHVVDPRTGKPAAGPQLPEMPGLMAARLLGWAPDGAAVVAATYPEPNASFQRLNSGSPFQLTYADTIRTVAILALTPGAAPRTLLSATNGAARNIDVSDQAIASGAYRTAHLPAGPNTHLWTGLTLLLAVLLIAAALTTLILTTTRYDRLRTGSPTFTPATRRSTGVIAHP